MAVVLPGVTYLSRCVAPSRRVASAMRRTRVVLLTGLLLAGLAVGLGISTAYAQAPDRELMQRVYEIADKLNCPLCQGQTLSECPLQVCEEMRAEIARRLQAGQSEQEILNAFVARYGIGVLNQPPVEGFNLLAWIIPFVGLAVVLALGGWALVTWSRRRQAAVQTTSVALEPLPDEYLRRLEEELKAFDEQ